MASSALRLGRVKLRQFVGEVQLGTARTTCKVQIPRILASNSLVQNAEISSLSHRRFADMTRELVVAGRTQG